MELPAALVVAVRRPREPHPAERRVVDVDPEPALVEVVGLQHLGRAVHAGQRPLPGLRQRGGVGARVLEQPRVQRDVEDLLGVRAGERVRARERCLQRVVVEHLEHLGQLLRRRHHRHVAVGAREDADRQQRVGRVGGESERLVVGVLPAEVATDTRRNAAERFERGDVDVGTLARRAGPERARQRAERGGVANRAECGDARRAHRDLERAPLRERDPRRGLRGEVGPGVVGVGTGGAEAADGDDHQRRELGADLVAIQAEGGEIARALALDHHVDRTEQLAELGPTVVAVVGDADGALVGVVVLVALGMVALGVAGRSLDLHHVGPEIGEDLAAVGAGGISGQLDDRDVAQQLTHGGETNSAPAITTSARPRCRGRGRRSGRATRSSPPSRSRSSGARRRGPTLPGT